MRITTSAAALASTALLAAIPTLALPSGPHPPNANSTAALESRQMGPNIIVRGAGPGPDSVVRLQTLDPDSAFYTEWKPLTDRPDGRVVSFVNLDGEVLSYPFMLHFKNSEITPKCHFSGTVKDKSKGATFIIHDAGEDNNYLEPCGSDKTNGIAMVCEEPRAICKR